MPLSNQNPPPREFKSNFYLGLLRDPDFFRDFVLWAFGQDELPQGIDFCAAKCLSERETGPKLRRSEADLVWEVRRKDGSETPILLLLEHLSQEEWTILLRLFRYELSLWERYARKYGVAGLKKKGLPPVYPLLFYTGEREWRAPVQFQELFFPGSPATPAVL